MLTPALRRRDALHKRDPRGEEVGEELHGGGWVRGVEDVLFGGREGMKYM